MNDLSGDIAAFRRFNRMYTRFIGTLQEGMHNTEYSLAEARVLYELAHGKPMAKDIAEALGIDPGYLSRLLAKLERAGLLKRKASAHDARYAEIALTRAGRAVFKRLDSSSDAQAHTVLDALPHTARANLIRSMKSIETILTPTSAADRPPFILRPHRSGDMGWVVAREGAVYTEEYGWDHTFEALVAKIVSDFITNFDPKREHCWMADADGESVGHIFLVKHPDQAGVAKLRLLFVEPRARGLGLGRALVAECLRFARSVGYRKVVLWTQSHLDAAHHIYVAAGFRLIHSEEHHSFGKDMIGETWELSL